VCDALQTTAWVLVVDDGDRLDTFTQITPPPPLFPLVMAP
jgi:hypothetical protein